MASLDIGRPPARTRRQAIARRFDGWTAATLLVAGLIAIPVVAVIAESFFPGEDIWSHLVSTVLPRYVANTFWLLIIVGAGVLVVGVATAWLVTMCRFPGSTAFEWLLLLPLSLPAYIIAITYTEILEFAGPVQGALRAAFGWETARDYWFPDIRSLGGAALMMILVLYPYVYLLARTAFLKQSGAALEVSRVLGRGPMQAFWSVALPLARPAIVIGLALALMEVLGDFGTVQLFAVDTFTTGIYRVWLELDNTPGAAQLSSLLLLFVTTMIVLEGWSRRAQRHHTTSARHMRLKPSRLNGWRRAAAVAACALPVAFGFALPFAVLSYNAFRTAEYTLSAALTWDILHSLTLAGMTAVLAVALGLVMAYGQRQSGTPVLRAANRFAALGYAVPGSVIAVGVLLPFGWLDNTIDGFMRATFGISTGLLLSGTIGAVVFAYLVRFLALSYGAVDAGLGKVTPHMDGAARTLGERPAGVLKRVHVPMIRGSLLTAGLLVFVDVMKELPATLILRPFNFDTLATRAYEYAVDEQFEESALWAVGIVLVGILPVILLSRAIRSAVSDDHSGP